MTPVDSWEQVAAEAERNVLTNKSVITQTSVVLAGIIFLVVIGIFASSALTALCGAYLCAVAAVGMVGLYWQQRHFTDPTGSFQIHAMFGLSTVTAITLPVLGVVEGETAAAVIGAILTAFCVTGWVASIRHERLIKPLGVLPPQ